MAAKIREFLAKAADAKLKELGEKYPPRGLAGVGKAHQTPEAAKKAPKRKTPKKAASKTGAQHKTAAQPRRKRGRGKRLSRPNAETPRPTDPAGPIQSE